MYLGQCLDTDVGGHESSFSCDCAVFVGKCFQRALLATARKVAIDRMCASRVRPVCKHLIIASVIYDAVQKHIPRMFHEN